MEISAEGSVRQQTYWDLLNCSEILPYSEKEARDVFFDSLHSSVTMRQIADYMQEARRQSEESGNEATEREATLRTARLMFGTLRTGLGQLRQDLVRARDA